MAVYVDNNRAKFRGMRMSHMTADTNEELDAMAEKIGLNPEWKQFGSIIHYDVSSSKRLLAIKHGAIGVTPIELVMKIRDNVEMKRNGLVVITEEGNDGRL